MFHQFLVHYFKTKRIKNNLKFTINSEGNLIGLFSSAN